MILNKQTFTTHDDRIGQHQATTFSYNSKVERDMESLLLRKDKSVAFVKDKDVERFGWTEYWTTAHFKIKEKFERVSGEYSL